MTKTPDEIKKGLKCCRESQDCTQDNIPKCPYYESETCLIELVDDALTLIQQLEADNAKKDETIQMLQDGNASLMRMIDEECEKTVTLEAERDAAVCDMTEIVQTSGDPYCEYCKNWKPGTCPPYCRTHSEGFRWRGVQKEATP